jgi:hypothetical protein
MHTKTLLRAAIVAALAVTDIASAQDERQEHRR